MDVKDLSKKNLRIFIRSHLVDQDYTDFLSQTLEFQKKKISVIVNSLQDIWIINIDNAFKLLLVSRVVTY